jgi:hypothetical protein
MVIHAVHAPTGEVVNKSKSNVLGLVAILVFLMVIAVPVVLTVLEFLGA